MSSYRATVLFLAATMAHFASAGLARADTKGGSNTPAAASTPATNPEMTLDEFLDRLMMAESGGRIYANNPRSTAVGPFQFIAATWLEIVNTSFADKTANMKPREILDLRTEPVFARQVAKAYSLSNAATLVANGFKATFANLRLAFQVGPRGATRVLAAKPKTAVSTLLGPVVITANPFMSRMTAADLIARAQRDIAAEPGSEAGIEPNSETIAAAKQSARRAPKITVACNLKLPSCRRWLALAERRAARNRQASQS